MQHIQENSRLWESLKQLPGLGTSVGKSVCLCGPISRDHPFLPDACDNSSVHGHAFNIQHRICSVLGDVGNLVGSFPTRCNVGKENAGKQAGAGADGKVQVSEVGTEFCLASKLSQKA